jgi:hypothetical protein
VLAAKAALIVAGETFTQKVGGAEATNYVNLNLVSPAHQILSAMSASNVQEGEKPWDDNCVVSASAPPPAEI